MIALTGATGFLGSHIADVLLDDGMDVRASVRSSSNLRWLEGKAIETMTLDLTSKEDCLKFLAGCDGVIHCAGVVSSTNEEAYQQGNVVTTETLLEAATELWGNDSISTSVTDPKPAFIFISSLAAHGPAGINHPAQEHNICQPITAYGRSKLEAENIVAEARWPFRRAILRPPGLYGPRDKDFLPLLKAASMGFSARIGLSMSGLSLVHGKDAARAAVALLKTESAAGPYFVDDGQRGYNWDELAEALGKMAHRKVRTLTIPLFLLKIAAALVGNKRASRSPVLNGDRIADLSTPGWVCDGRLLVEDTGFYPEFKADKGFTDTMAFYKEHGWL